MLCCYGALNSISMNSCSCDLLMLTAATLPLFLTPLCLSLFLPSSILHPSSSLSSTALTMYPVTAAGEVDRSNEMPAIAVAGSLYAQAQTAAEHIGTFIVNGVSQQDSCVLYYLRTFIQSLTRDGSAAALAKAAAIQSYINRLEHNWNDYTIWLDIGLQFNDADSGMSESEFIALLSQPHITPPPDDDIPLEQADPQELAADEEFLASLPADFLHTQRAQ